MAVARRSVSRHSASRRSASRRSASRGFTLVSIIVAMVILAVAASALATANATTIAMQTIAQNRTNAVAIARAYTEQLRSRDPWLLQSESAVRLGADGVPSADGAYVRTVEVTPIRQNLVRVEVTVDFPRSAQPLRLTTSVFRGNGLAGAP